MRFRMGWSGEVSNGRWEKLDVELDSDDLLRILRENDLPEDLLLRLPTRLCFQLIQNETEFLLLNKLKDIGFPDAKLRPRQADLIASTGEIIDAIKKQLAPA